MIESGMDTPAVLRSILPGDEDPDWTLRSTTFYFSPRGVLRNGASLGLRKPKRLTNRMRLSNLLNGFRGSKVGRLQVLFVGVGGEEFDELNTLVQQPWADHGGLDCVFIGSDSKLSEELNEWGIRSINGTINDFLSACS